jgi:hypothetical protein
MRRHLLAAGLAVSCLALAPALGLGAESDPAPESPPDRASLTVGPPGPQATLGEEGPESPPAPPGEESPDNPPAPSADQGLEAPPAPPGEESP